MAPQNLTLISHFRNEEYLLSFWVPHHAKIFKNAVLIDYGSEDLSREVIRELAPHWKVVNTKNTDFNSDDIDREVMEIESEIEGWKICLNTTEFLVGDPQGEIEKLEDHVEGIRLNGRTLVDREPTAELPLGSSLVSRKPWGLDEFQYLAHRLEGTMKGIDPQLLLALDPICRGRLLHRSSSAGYAPGRHGWDLAAVEFSRDLEVWWCGLSPWTSEGKRRKIAMGAAVPKEDLIRGRGTYHLLGLKELEAAREVLAPLALANRYSIGECRNALEKFTKRSSLFSPKKFLNFILSVIVRVKKKIESSLSHQPNHVNSTAGQMTSEQESSQGPIR